MATVELTKDNVGRRGPCRMFAAVFEQAAERHDDITFARVNPEVELELARAFQISSVPTLVAVRDGVVL